MGRGLQPEVAAAARSSASTMTAAVFRSFEPPSVLQLETDFPRPTRRKGEVLIKVMAASINPIDWKTRKGDVPRFTVTRPKIPGGDVAGLVEEADTGSQFKPGDRVFGCNGNQVFWSTYGTYAEYALAHEDSLLPIPEGWSFNEAAAVPLAAMTAWQAMQPSMPLQGKRVLVHAGAGGVGSYAVQIAKAQGAWVATTCSGKNAAFVTDTLGADMAIDYTKQKFEEASPEPYDLVVDLIGGDYELRSLPLLKRSGHFAHVLNSGFTNQYGHVKGSALLTYYLARHLLKSKITGPRYTFTIMKHQARHGLTELVKLMQAGKLKVTIAQVLPLAEAARAHEISEDGHVRGKLVLQVAQERA